MLRLSVAAAAVAMLGSLAAARADTARTHDKTDAHAAADNTAVNKRDRDGPNPTADQQNDKGMGISEYEAKRYEGLVKEGGILLSVHSDNSDWTSKGKKILEAYKAKDISSAGEASAETKSPVGT
jgi:hypothetical protein